MKVLVTGVTGQLGYDVMKELERRRIQAAAASRDQFDITDETAVRSFIAAARPDTVIHCAAYTAVDKAEDEPDLCRRVNSDGTRNVAAACRDTGAKMIYISTDYVFPGTGTAPYEPDDTTGPQNVYGASKLAGEQAVRELLEKYFIVRISWVFGVNGKNFVRTMLRFAQSHKELNVVDDQIGSPTYTADLAPLLCSMAETEKYGVYHATNEGFCSWAQFAEEIFKDAGLDVKVNPIPTSAYPSKAKRPLNSRLSKACLDAAGFNRLPSWQNAVKRYVKLLTKISVS
jgi:dTDP-4-dehydrorhamnose reductase